MAQTTLQVTPLKEMKEKIYEDIIGTYGNRRAFIAEIAERYGVSRRSANHLTFVLGYRRGKAPAEQVPFDVFEKDAWVNKIAGEIAAEKAKAAAAKQADPAAAGTP